MKRTFSLAALAALAACIAQAQDIAGDWQGTLTAGSHQLRIILHIDGRDGGAKREGGWSGMLYSIDQGPEGTPISSLALQHSTLNLP